jgi:hypothetical protein
VAILPRKRRLNDPDLRDRLYELLEHDHLPYSVGSRFVRLIADTAEAAKGDLAAAEVAQAKHDDQPAKE